jgi:hypothetical protein
LVIDLRFWSICSAEPEKKKKKKKKDEEPIAEETKVMPPTPPDKMYRYIHGLFHVSNHICLYKQPSGEVKYVYYVKGASEVFSIFHVMF